LVCSGFIDGYIDDTDFRFDCLLFIAADLKKKDFRNSAGSKIIPYVKSNSTTIRQYYYPSNSSSRRSLCCVDRSFCFALLCVVADDNESELTAHAAAVGGRYSNFNSAPQTRRSK
jgi:hypothetical protein